MIMHSPAIHTHTFRAMNCQMAAWVCTDEVDAARSALLAVEHWMQLVERELSRFRPDSDLSRLNAAAGQPYRAGKLLWQVIQQALIWAEATAGIFDPTVGRDLIEAGYHRSFETFTHTPHSAETIPAPISSTYPPATWRDIHLDPDTHTITLPPGIQLDLGGIAKGWAADQALDMLKPLGPALVDAGGDLAIGHPPPHQDGWPLAVADPLSPEEDLVLLSLAQTGMATSGTDHRRWRHRGRQQHHLIDPQRHRPAQTDILTATVIAPTATEADVLALMLVIMGMEAATSWLTTHPNIPALLVLNDGRTYQNPAFAHHARAYFPAYA